MTITVNYINHYESQLCLTMNTGDTLAAFGGAPAIAGPAIVYCPVDGSNPIYKQIVNQGLLASALHPAKPAKPT